MDKDLYQCSCRQLATYDPDTLDSGETVQGAIDWFHETGFDYAPVVDGDVPVGYTGLELLQDEGKEKKLKRVCKPIGLADTISADATFREVLDALEDQFYYFLGGRNRVTGILTRADLNTSPARMHLFDRISVLEIHLRGLVNKYAVDWFDEMYFDEKTENQIKGRYEEAQDANIELEMINYAGFNTLTRVIAEYEECWERCGYAKEHQASARLNKIQDLRNDVAHSNLILQTTEEGNGSDARSIRDLRKTYSRMMSVINTLKENQ